MSKQVEKWLAFSKQSVHPVLPPVGQGQVVALIQEHGDEGGWNIAREAIALREQRIAQELLDPLRYGWEPPIWWLCDALSGQRFASPAWCVRFPGVDWGVWAAGVRLRFGFGDDDYWKVFLIEGANRAAKSEYASKRVVLTLVEIDESRAWCFHSNTLNSLEYQQPLIYKYLPLEWRNAKIKGQVGNINYSRKNGFGDANSSGRFITPNGSECVFRNYSQDRDKIEGGEIDVGWPDELVPQDWVDTLKARIATRKGRIVITFTAIEGYTPTVRMFEDGAETLVEEPAFLVPRDGGEPDVPRAMGFASLEDMLHAHDEGRWSLAREFDWMDGIAEGIRSKGKGVRAERAA